MNDAAMSEFVKPNAWELSVHPVAGHPKLLEAPPAEGNYSLKRRQASAGAKGVGASHAGVRKLL